jgi:tryptophan synthase alpha subunit
MAATHDVVGHDHQARHLVIDAIDEYITGLHRHIENGQAAGFIDPSLPPAETAYWLQWMAERGLHQIPLAADDAEIDRLIDAYTAIVWNTLYSPTRK